MEQTVRLIRIPCNIIVRTLLPDIIHTIYTTNVNKDTVKILIFQPLEIQVPIQYFQDKSKPLNLPRMALFLVGDHLGNFCIMTSHNTGTSIHVRQTLYKIFYQFDLHFNGHAKSQMKIGITKYVAFDQTFKCKFD